MSKYAKLKALWKKLGVKGQVKNYSSLELWVVESDSTDYPIARILTPGHKTPKHIDVDGFKRVDGVAINKHKNWWKFYDFSTVEIFQLRSGLRISAVMMVRVGEGEFGKVRYKKEKWGDRISVILDVKRNSQKKIVSYYVNDKGWLGFDETLELVCRHRIDNARPVFPKKGAPYIRSKRDKSILNNFSRKDLS